MAPITPDFYFLLNFFGLANLTVSV